MRAFPEDEHYTSLRYRYIRHQLVEVGGIDFEVVEGLQVPAAFCPWQRIMWVRPNLPDMPLLAWITDVASSIHTKSLDTIRYFTREASEQVQAMTCSHALVVPGRGRGRGHDPRQHLMSVAM